MRFKETLLKAAPISGLMGVVSISLGILLSAIAYRGRAGEGYSFLNHFVSELGEVAQSEFALAFNLGLVIGGILLLGFLLGLALYVGKWFGWILGFCGLITSISGALVGVFPMDNLEPHYRVAMTFFYMGLLITIIFSVFVLFFDDERIFNKWLAVPGLVSAVSFFYFLFLTDPIVPEDAPLQSLIEALENRPDVWETAIFEWIVVITILVWIVSLSLYLLNSASIRHKPL